MDQGFPDENGAAQTQEDSGSSRPPIALDEGTVLREEYRVEEVLGTGSFGITYRAVDEHLDTSVAIKEFYPRQIAGRSEDSSTIRPYSSQAIEDFEHGLRKFMEEGRTIARFDHPNVVDVRSYFEGNGTGYLVMDYYEGQSLAEYLAENNGRLPEKEATELIQNVLAGLRPVHEAGVLHRDIDPQNIYRTEEGEAILIDFGAAREAAQKQSQSLDVILKPGYAPIEQYSSGGNQGPWTDIYACAATLYKCLTGIEPPEATERVQEDNLIPPREVREEISVETGLAVRKGLALYPDRRARSASEFAELLGRPLAEESQSQTQRAGPTQVPEPEASEASPTPVGEKSEAQGKAADDRTQQKSGKTDREDPEKLTSGEEIPNPAEKDSSGDATGADSWSLLAIGAAVALAVGGGLLFSDASTIRVLGFFGTWAVVSIGIVVLFREGEKAMSQEARAAVSDWLLREDFVERPSEWPETFANLFDAVFTEEHFSWTCFKRSVMVSVTSVLVVSAALVMLELLPLGTFTTMNSEGSPEPPFSTVTITILGMSSILLYNSIFDYISLYETRKVLEINFANIPFRGLLILLIDLFSTLIVIYFGVLVSQLVVNIIQGIYICADGLFSLRFWIAMLYIPIQAFKSVYPFGDGPVTSAIYTTFSTSMWVWGYVLSGYLIRALHPFLAGVRFLKENLDVKSRPVHSMGIILAVLSSIGFGLGTPFVL